MNMLFTGSTNQLRKTPNGWINYVRGMVLSINYDGQVLTVPFDKPFAIGRSGDLVLDTDNTSLPRRLLVIKQRDGLWWLSNVGHRVSANISTQISGMEARLLPGNRLPLVFPSFVVWLAAGNASYDFEIVCNDAPFRASPIEMGASNGERGTVVWTADQRRLIVALAENTLRNVNRGVVPTSRQAAARLGWAMTRFNRKLDNVCCKLENLGVEGLHGGPTQLAISRKTRLVEYAVGTGLVTRQDLVLLPDLRQQNDGDKVMRPE